MKEAEKVAKLCVCGKVALNISCFSLSPKMDDKNEVDNARAVAAFFYFFWYHTHTHIPFYYENEKRFIYPTT